MVGEDFSASLNLRHLTMRGCNSIGRMSALQAEYRRFKSLHTDQDLIYNGALAQLARAIALQAIGYGFNSHMFHQYMKEAIDMVVEEFKIVQEFVISFPICMEQ